MGLFWRLYCPSEFVRSMNTLNNFIAPFVERAISLSTTEIESMKQMDGEQNFIHSLGLFTKDRKVIRDQLVSTLLAGRDTTACALSWLFYELSYHPNVFVKLREEVLRTVGKKGKPTYDNLKGMKYLQWCINESKIPSQNYLTSALRLYPIVPFNVRAALRDTTLPHGGGPQGLDVILFR
jgi:cytochrome P450